MIFVFNNKNDFTGNSRTWIDKAVILWFTRI